MLQPLGNGLSRDSLHPRPRLPFTLEHRIPRDCPTAPAGHVSASGILRAGWVGRRPSMNTLSTRKRSDSPTQSVIPLVGCIQPRPQPDSSPGWGFDLLSGGSTGMVFDVVAVAISGARGGFTRIWSRPGTQRGTTEINRTSLLHSPRDAFTQCLARTGEDSRQSNDQRSAAMPRCFSRTPASGNQRLHRGADMVPTRHSVPTTSGFVRGNYIFNINRLSGAGDRDRTDDIQLGKL